MKGFWKFIRTYYIQLIIAVEIFGTAFIMLFVASDPYHTLDHISDTYMELPIASLEQSLNGYFLPMTRTIWTSVDHAKEGRFDPNAKEDVIAYFKPILDNRSQITSMGVANDSGYEFDILKSDDGWTSRMVDYSNDPNHCIWSAWNDETDIDSTWLDSVPHDPRARPWYSGAVNSDGGLYWTEPYKFNTSDKYGITLSVAYSHDDRDSNIIAFDLLLEQLAELTRGVSLQFPGTAFITTSKLERVNPLAPDNDNELMRELFMGELPDTIKPQCFEAIKQFTSSEDSDRWKNMSIRANGEKWMVRFKRYHFGADHFIIGVVISEKVMLGNIFDSEQMIGIAMLMVSLIVIMLVFSQYQIFVRNRLLTSSNEVIAEQRQAIAEKNKHLVESIEYARSLQNALLVPLDEVKRIIPDSFVVNMPKDVVSGDFYWVRQQENHICFAVADCTGHGVPGAFMSVLSMDILDLVYKQHIGKGTGQLLGELRDGMVEKMTASGHGHRDGMDIGICGYDKLTHRISFSGAYSNLYVLRKVRHTDQPLQCELNGDSQALLPTHFASGFATYTMKGDRSPVGFVDPEMVKPFTSVEFELEQGDTLFLTTDGFLDQFGGANDTKYGRNRFLQLLIDMADLPMEEQAKQVAESINTWRGNGEQTDDICVMGVQLT